MLKFHVVTLFPDMFGSYLSESILKRAIADKKISVQFYNPMDFSEPSPQGKLPRRIDDKPYGGGPGMVLRPEPVLRAIAKAVGRKRKYKIIHFGPRGHKFDTAYAQNCATSVGDKTITDIVFVCGRYEGIDSRVEEIYPGDVLSIGDYVLTGGELPAMVMIDSIARQIPGVLGDFDSREEARVSAGRYYTRPETLKWKKKTYSVPEVLLSGDHKKIDQWRQDHA